MSDREEKTGTTHTRLVAMTEDGERRLNGRVPVHLPATFTSESLEMDVELEVRNVSSGGLFVRSDFLEPTGTEVRLRVAFAERDVNVRGRVAWVAEHASNGPGMGIELDEPSREAWLAAGVPKIA